MIQPCLGGCSSVLYARNMKVFLGVNLLTGNLHNNTNSMLFTLAVIGTRPTGSQDCGNCYRAENVSYL